MLYEEDCITIYVPSNRDDNTLFKGKIANYNKLLDVMEIIGINKTA